MNLAFDKQNLFPLRVTKLIMCTTREDYQEVYRRGYEVRATSGTLANYEKLMARVGYSGEVIPIELAANIPEVITPMAVPIDKALIPNGWRTKRIRFIMEVTQQISNTVSVKIYIQGYSDYFDMSISGMLDPGIMMYINSMTIVDCSLDMSTGIQKVIPRQTFNVVADVNGMASYQEVLAPQTDMVLARPYDIVNNAYMGSTYVDGSFINVAGNISNNTAHTSQKANNDPTNYICKLVNGYNKAMATARISSDSTDILRAAGDTQDVAETNLYNNPFIQALAQISISINPTSFTLAMLKEIDPNVENVAQLVDNSYKPIISNNIGYNQDEMDNEVSNVLYSSDIESVFASSLANSVNACIIENMVTALAVNITNMSVNTNGPEVLILRCESFIDGINTMFYLNRIKAYLETVVIPQLTKNNLHVVSIFIDTDILRDTVVKISVNGNPYILYRFPTFADSLYIPTVTTNSGRDGITQEFTTLTDVASSMGYDYNGLAV